MFSPIDDVQAAGFEVRVDVWGKLWVVGERTRQLTRKRLAGTT